MEVYSKKVPLAFMSGLVVTADMSCKARHLTEEFDEKENADFHLLLYQVLYNHNSSVLQSFTRLRLNCLLNANRISAEKKERGRMKG